MVPALPWQRNNPIHLHNRLRTGALYHFYQRGLNDFIFPRIDLAGESFHLDIGADNACVARSWMRLL